MRHTLALAFSASAAIAFAAAPANAATVVYSSGSTITVTPSSVPNTYDAPFEFRVLNTVPVATDGQFTATFTFDAPCAGAASAIAQNIIVRGRFGSDVDFTGAS